MKRCVLFCGLLIFAQALLAQTSYTWNGSTSTSWNTPTNWTPNGVPGAVDNATIVTGSNNCLLGSSTSINNLTLTSGTLNMGGGTLTVNGTNAVFTTGTVQNGTLTVTGATTTTFGNGPVTMNCTVNITSAAITEKNTVFQGATTITKTGATNDASGGGNTFNGALNATNAGSGYLMFGNGNADQFNSTATFNNTGSNSIYVANNGSGGVFAGVTTFNNAPTANSGIYVSWNSAGTVFNNNIIVSSSGGTGVQFCGGNTTASSTLSAGYTITVGSGGFSAGTLLLRQFNQTGATAQSLSLSGAGSLNFGPSSTFGGNLTASSPALILSGATFNGTTNLTKTGATGDWGAGGNIYNGVCSITNSGSSYLVMGNNSPDSWNNDVTFTDNGSERILPAWATVGNQFNGNIYVNTSGSATGVQFCGGNTTATATLAAGKTIAAGTGGLTAGYLYLKQFTQAGGQPVNLTATGSSVLYLGPSSNFGGVVNVTAPDIWAQGATYNSAATFTKTGGTSDHNNQYQNIFNSTCTINQQSSTGYFMLGYNSNDQFNGNITVTSTGTGGIYLGWTSGTGTPTLAAGNTIQVGPAGFSTGFLYLNTFTQLGNANINLSFTGTNTYLAIARSSVIGGSLTTNTPDIYFNGGTFNGNVNATKTSANNDYSSGGNIFQDSATYNVTGAGYMALGNGTADTWNGPAIFNSTGSAYVAPAWNSAGNMFNGNIVVTSTGSSAGVQFCLGNGASTATLAAGDTLEIGSAGFSSGTLQLRQFTQLGSAPTNLSLTGATTLLQTGPSSAFGGDFTVVSPRILLNGTVFTDTTVLTKTGATGEWSFGGNTFNSTLTVNQQGSGYFGFANGAADIYNGDVYANNNSTERIIFGNNPIGNQFSGNIILTQIGSSVGIAFGWSATTSETMAAGKTISIGAAGFSTGYLQIERFTQLGSTPMNLTLTGNASLTFGPTSTIGGNLTTSSPAILFNGCTFNGTVNSTKTGATNDYSSGGNVFNNTTTITGAGSGYVALAGTNPDQFNSVSTFNNTGSANFYVANNSSNNTFGGTTTFNNTPTANTLIYVSQSSTGTIFNGNIVFTSTNGQGVQFCTGNATATATLSAGDTLSIGPGGFSAGTLYLRQFTQLGSAPSNLTLTGVTTLLQMGPSSAFGGDFTAVSPRILVNGAVFSDTTSLTKTGATGEWSNGGNTFNSTLTINQFGSGYFGWENSAPDIFNGDVYANNNSTERIIFGNNSGGGTQFNGNIILTQTGSSVGIAFGWSGSTSETMAAGGTISIGAAGFSTGYLQIERFTQLGSTAMNLPLTGTSALIFGPSSAIGGNLLSTSGSLYFNGCTFSGTVNSTKTGTTNDNSSGNNIFNGVTAITDAASGYLLFGNGNSDQFNSQSTFNNTGSANMYIAYNSTNNTFGGTATFNNTPTANTAIYVSQYSAGTIFNGNIVVNSTNGQGILFCNGNTTATATLSAGNSISVGAGGFSAGTLLLRQFTQSGSTVQSLTLTGAGNLTFGPSSAIGGNITTVSPTLLFNGCIFGGTVTSTKNGTSSDASSGNNTFDGPFVVTNTGAGYLLLGNGNPDLWQSTAVFNNYSSTQNMYVAYNSTGNTFNGDVTFNNQPGATGLWIYPNVYGISTAFNGNIFVENVNGGGVYFGSNTGTATLTNGAISVGSAGFNSGGLIFRSFTQATSGTAQSITTTGTSYIQYGASAAFSGPLTSSSPGLLFDGCVFNGSVNATKTGSSNDQSIGNNTFNGPSTFTNTGTGYLMMTNNNPDTYNGNIVFVQSGTGKVYPNYNNNSPYNGNLTVTSPAGTAITFGSGSGTATLSGTAGQTIGITPGTPTPIFTRLVINNSSNSGVTLSNTNISVSNNVVFTTGLLNTTTSYMLVMLNGSTTAAGNALSTSYVNGPMQYQKSTAGSSTLNFPIGNGADCRPFVLTVDHSTGTLYTYTATLYNASASALNWTLPLTVDHVSQVHYYTINRADGSGNNQPTAGLSGDQTIQMFFGQDDWVSNGGTLTICKNIYTAPTTWIDIGGTGGPMYNAGAALTGSITSTSSPSLFNSFSTFTLGDKINGGNVLPIGLLSFSAVPDNSQVDVQWTTATESNNSFFTVERSKDEVNFDSIARVATEAPDGTSSTPLNYSAVDPHPYTGVSYYRLKQTDLDGNASYSNIIPVNFVQKLSFSVYPNPSKGALYITGMDLTTTSVMTQWFDISGKLLAQALVPVQGGAANLNVNFNNGIYLLRMIFPDGSSSAQNIIILK
jgi:hypothetical protein